MFNDNLNQTLLNINKINDMPNNKYEFKKLSNFKENTIKNLKLSLVKMGSDKIEGKNDLNKDENKPNKFFSSSLKNIKTLKLTKNADITYNNNDQIDINSINEEPNPFLDKSIYSPKNHLKSNNQKMKSFNLKNKTIKFQNFSKKNFKFSKFSLHKNAQSERLNDRKNEEENPSNTNKLFATEICLENTNEHSKLNSNINTNNYTYNNYLHNKSNAHLDSKKNLSTEIDKYSNNNYEDPLLIPKEDLIFEEIKKYKCFKYFTQEELNKTGAPFIYIQMNMNPNKDLKNTNKNNYGYKALNDKIFLQKLVKSGKDKIFLSKRYNKDLTNERRKEILDNIYKIKTAPDLYKRIEYVKSKKDRKKLKNYQNNFLKLVKHNITNKYYESLKDKFCEIRDVAEGKYNTNFKFIKEIEKNEENAINNINEICNKYKKYFAHKNMNKLFVKSVGPRLKLPKIKFIKITKKDYFSDDEKINKIKKKNKLFKNRKYMSKTCNKFIKDISNNESYKVKDVMLSKTNYNGFKNLKSDSSKVI